MQKNHIVNMVKPCSKEDTLNIVRVALQCSIVLSLYEDLTNDESPLLKQKFKSVLIELEPIFERASTELLGYIEKADEQVNLNLLKLYYDFNKPVKIVDGKINLTQSHLLVSYCSSIFRTIHSMHYTNATLTHVKNICHKVVAIYNRQYTKYADIEYNDKNVLLILTESLQTLTNSILFSK